MSYPKQFYVHKFNDTRDVSNYQSSLYWNPNITLTQEKKVAIYFEPSGKPSKYKIIIEGITSFGKPIQAEAFFTLN